MNSRPNILWLCSDQQRWDTLGCYGNSHVRTPNLDALAKSGVVFDRCYSQSTICTPSRACFLTGRYPRTTRCRQNGQDIPEDEVLVTRLLSENGYTCGLSGKLHISACHPSTGRSPERRINDGYSEFYWSHHPDPNWKDNQYIQWLQRKGVTFGREQHPDSRHVTYGPAAEDHQTTWCAERAMDFVTRHAQDSNPWCFSVNFFDPHFPFDAPRVYMERYEEAIDDVPLPNYVEGELGGKPSHQRAVFERGQSGKGSYPFASMTPRDHRLVRASYWAMCDLIDRQAGRILDTLQQTGQLANTIVIYMSDHGEMLGDHGLYLKGEYFYEPAVRVPLIVSWPEHIRPARSTALVELVDTTQTLLDAIGLPHHPGMQGRSLWPLLTGNASVSEHRGNVYCELYSGRQLQGEQASLGTMVRDDRHKLVVYHRTKEGELYDLQSDPLESTNLWSDPGFADVKAGLMFALCNRMAFTADTLPVPISAW
jgi:choline-sulfatase